MLEYAMNYLSQNPLLHMGMIVPIKRGTAHILYADEGGVCLIDKNSGAYMMSVSSYETGIRLLNLLPDEGLFSFHQAFMLDSFKAKMRYTTLLTNYQAVYFSNDFLSVDSCLVINPFKSSDFETVIHNYDIEAGADYLLKRIEEGELFGGYVNTTLIGFAGIHAEGSIGMLKVFPQYRRKGYGTALTCFLVNHQLSQGIMPFEQIGVTNDSSLKLAVKLGFTISAGYVYWMF